jgi:hypothetical protein
LGVQNNHHFNEKTEAANEIIAATNPFNYNLMTKVLKEKKLDGFLARDFKKKEEKRKVCYQETMEPQGKLWIQIIVIEVLDLTF